MRLRMYTSLSDRNSYTYKWVSKSIIHHLENADQTFEGFVKRELVTRVLGIGISFFQAVDCVVFVSEIATRKVESFSSKQGFELAQLVVGIFFGSFLSMINPSCFVPLLYAPDQGILNDPVDKTQTYDFDRHFDQTMAINLKQATGKLDVLTDHLRELGVNNWERFEAVNGYELSDEQEIHIRDKALKVKDLYEKLPGKGTKDKKARLGCYLSHLNVLKQAKSRGLSSVLIIEDDAHFPQTKRGAVSFQKTMEELPDNWELLFIGIEHDKKPVRFSPSVDRVESGTCLHAYAVHSRCYDKLIAALEDALLDEERFLLPVDEVLSEQIERKQYQAFAPHLMVGYQRNGLQSNITGKTNSAYPFSRQITQRIYAYMVAPWLTPLGLPKYRIYKNGMRMGLGQ